jgi:hypothetical protein
MSYVGAILYSWPPHGTVSSYLVYFFVIPELKLFYVLWLEAPLPIGEGEYYYEGSLKGSRTGCSAPLLCRGRW